MTDDRYPRLVVSRKTGHESFVDGDRALPFNVLSFWQWAASDLASNTLRGLVAEFLVARAIGTHETLRLEWDAYDLRTPEGITIEVKTSAYLQTWTQKKLSTIKFDIAPTKGWNATTNEYGADLRRQADIYVFALLAHQEKATLNPLDVRQWQFFVLRAATLNARHATQKQLGLAGLLALSPTQSSFATLSAAIARSAEDLGGVSTDEQS